MDQRLERQRIGLRIQELREEKGLSREDLALKAGLTVSNIQRIELGKYNFTLDILSQIGRVFDKQIDYK